MYNNLEIGTTIKFYLDLMENYTIGVIEAVEDGRYKVAIKNMAVKSVFVEPNDISEVIDKNKKFEFIEEKPIEIVYEKPIPIPVVEKKHIYQGLFAEGGLADVETIDGLPNELTIYIPLFDADGKPVSDEQIEMRVGDVKHFLKSNFGDFVNEDMGSSYIDREGNLIMRKTIQITAYPSNEEFNNHKSHLINQLSLWASEWGQEFMILEYEDSIFFILGMNDMMKQGGELWIQDAVKQMEKKGTIGAFTKQAKREGLTPINFAKKVLENPKGYALKTRRRANFVKNMNPEKF